VTGVTDRKSGGVDYRFVELRRSVRSRATRSVVLVMIAVLMVWAVTVSAAVIAPAHASECHRVPGAAHESASAHQHGAAMAGHDCCDRPAKTDAPHSKRCCPHPEGLAPRPCATGEACCRIEARELTNTRSERDRRRDERHKKIEANESSAAVLVSAQRSRSLLKTGLRYERPVLALKTDLRI
jgi:hypothetical protein